MKLSNVNCRNTRARCEICLLLTIKTPERRYWLVSIVNFDQVDPGRTPNSIFYRTCQSPTNTFFTEPLSLAWLRLTKTWFLDITVKLETRAKYHLENSPFLKSNHSLSQKFVVTEEMEVNVRNLDIFFCFYQ